MHKTLGLTEDIHPLVFVDYHFFIKEIHGKSCMETTQSCVGICLTTSSPGETTFWFIIFADFHSIATTSMADFKISTKCH